MINWLMFFLDWGGVCANIVSNIFLFRKKIEYWMWSMLGNTLWFVYFWMGQKWLSAGLQVTFFMFSLYGWRKWQLEAKGKGDQLWFERLGTALALIILGYAFLITSFVNIDAWMEGIAVTLFVIANWMTARKWTISWYVWMLGNIVFAAWLWRMQAMGMFVAQFVFFGLSVYGLYAWKKSEIESSVQKGKTAISIEPFLH